MKTEVDADVTADSDGGSCYQTRRSIRTRKNPRSQHKDGGMGEMVPFGLFGRGLVEALVRRKGPREESLQMSRTVTSPRGKKGNSSKHPAKGRRV
jgi:hypothetical protein